MPVVDGFTNNFSIYRGVRSDCSLFQEFNVRFWHKADMPPLRQSSYSIEMSFPV